MSTPALHYLLEFTRVHAAEDTYAFRQGLETYIIRAAGGRHQGTRGKRAQLDWSDAGLQADLAVLRGQVSAAAHTSHDERLQRMGGRLRRFLGEADWSRHEAEIEALLERARALDTLVHITIRSDAAELYALPWELLVLEGSGQLLGEIDRVVVGYAWPDTRTDASTAALAAGPKRGRLLMAWSDAGGRVPSMAHTDALTRACAAGPLWFDPARDVLAQVSASSLAQTLAHAAAAGEPYSALHVLCHGREDLDACVLAWHHERGLPEPALLTAASVRRVIEPHTGELRLVTLCACNSSDVGAPGTHLGSIAQALHRIGVPWVVGSRSLLSKRGATDFAMVFYEALASGAAGEPAAGSAGIPAHGQETAHASVERAFARARRELALGHSDVGDWISMQLYARPEDRGAGIWLTSAGSQAAPTSAEGEPSARMPEVLPEPRARPANRGWPARVLVGLGAAGILAGALFFLRGASEHPTRGPEAYAPNADVSMEADARDAGSGAQAFAQEDAAAVVDATQAVTAAGEPASAAREAQPATQKAARPRPQTPAAMGPKMATPDEPGAAGITKNVVRGNRLGKDSSVTVAGDDNQVSDNVMGDGARIDVHGNRAGSRNQVDNNQMGDNSSLTVGGTNH